MWASASCISLASMDASVRPGSGEVLVEPGAHPAPRIGSGARHIRVRTYVAVEAVASVAVPDDVVVDRRVVERLPQLLDVVDGDRLVLVAEEPEPRCLQRLGLVDQRRELWEPSADDPAPVVADPGADLPTG